MSDTTGAAQTRAASTDAPVQLSILDAGDAVHETRQAAARPKQAGRPSSSEPPRERPEEDEIPASEDADTQPDELPGASEGDLEGEEGEAGGEAEAEPSEGEEPDPESERERQTRSDKKERLRDGREITIGELKRAYEDKAAYEARLNTDFQARVRDVDVQRQHFYQAAQQFQQQLQQVVAKSQAAIPPPPDEKLRETDPFAFQQQWIDRRDAIDRWQAENSRLQQVQQYQQYQQAQQVQQLVTTEREKLFQHLPELRDESKRASYYQETARHLHKTYGIPMGALGNVVDSAHMLIVHKSVLYDKLMAERSKSKETLKAKTAGAPPVQRPPVQNGIRPNAGARDVRAIQDLKRLQRDPTASARERTRASEALLSRF